MELFIHLTVTFVDLLLGLVFFAMFIRAIMSLFMVSEDNKIFMLVFTVTEPFIIPMRALLDRLGLFQGLPIDMSFMFTSIMIIIVRTVLQSIPM